MKNPLFYIIVIAFSFQSCIGDDIIFDTIEPEIRILNSIDSLQLNTTHKFEFSYFNNVGELQTDILPLWSSSSPSVISIDSDGTAFAQSLGSSIIMVEYISGENLIRDSIKVNVGMETVVSNTNRSGIIRTTSSYVLSGDFIIESNNSGGIEIKFAANFNASTALPGLYIYLTNNPNTTSGAREIQKVATFSGAHTIEVKDVELNDYSHILYFCKPFNVKVGDGKIE